MKNLNIKTKLDEHRFSPDRSSSTATSMRSFFPRAARLAALAFVALPFVACSDSGSSVSAGGTRTVTGTSAALGSGTATSWVKTDSAGRAVAMGLSFGDAALTGLPADMSMTVLPLPQIAGLPFDTAIVN